MSDKHTEASIQNWLYRHSNLKNHEHMVPNIFLYAWESDFISVTRAGFITEYEIKISKPDFKNDFEKTAKHEVLKDGVYTVTDAYELSKLTKAGKVNNGKTPGARPNYFYYVCPKDLIQPEEVPVYAGLVYATNWYNGIVKKKALKLHTDSITEKQIQQIKTCFFYRYWAMRLKLHGEELEKLTVYLGNDKKEILVTSESY